MPMTPSTSTIAIETGVSLAVAMTGDPSGPTLVLLPGPTDSWRSYQPVLERVPRSIHTIAVSQRGHGDSDKPPTGYRVQDFAADVPPLLDALGVPRAVLAGHSGSCLVARRVALDHPERVAGLVLEASPSSLCGHEGLMGFVESVVSNLEDPMNPEFAREFVADTSSDDLAPELVAEMADEVMKVPVPVWQEMFSTLLEYDDLDELGRLAAPTLLVWGDADGLVDRAMQTLLVDRIDGAELLIFDGVGHTPRWEDPDRFAREIAAFVERVALRSPDPHVPR